MLTQKSQREHLHGRCHVAKRKDFVLLLCVLKIYIFVCCLKGKTFP